METALREESSPLDSTLGPTFKGTGERLSFQSSIFHLHDEESEHEHEHTSTSEDDLFKLLDLPEHTQTWTPFDTKAKTLSHHVILGTIVGECCCATHDQ